MHDVSNLLFKRIQSILIYCEINQTIRPSKAVIQSRESKMTVSKNDYTNTHVYINFHLFDKITQKQRFASCSSCCS